MEISMSQQLSTIIISLITGAFLGVIYDTVRFIRCALGIKYCNNSFKCSIKTIKTKEKTRLTGLKENIIIHITDILFFIICGIVIAILVYYSNNGRVRWFIYFFSAIGFLIYYLTIGKIIIRLSGVITEVLKSIVYYTFYLIVYPLLPIRNFAKLLFTKIHTEFKIKKAKKRNEKLGHRNILINYGK